MKKQEEACYVSKELYMLVLRFPGGREWSHWGDYCETEEITENNEGVGGKNATPSRKIDNSEDMAAVK